MYCVLIYIYICRSRQGQYQRIRVYVGRVINQTGQQRVVYRNTESKQGHVLKLRTLLVHVFGIWGSSSAE